MINKARESLAKFEVHLNEPASEVLRKLNILKKRAEAAGIKNIDTKSISQIKKELDNL